MNARYSTGIAMQAVKHFPDVNDVDVDELLYDVV